MSINSRIFRLALALLFITFGAAVLAQEAGPEPLTGESFYPSESLRGIESVLVQLVESNVEQDVLSLDGLLEPANTNSPRDTIISFIKLTQRYYDLLIQDTYTEEDTAELEHLYDEMQWFFDLRRVAPSLRDDRAVNAAVYLREVIDRIGLPQLAKIPNRKQMLAAISEGYPPSWQIGNSPLIITRIDEGRNEGKYLFSRQTLEAVKGLYSQLKPFPYRSAAAKDFYKASFLTPRPTLQAWTDAFPSWMQLGFYGQTVWQWLALVLLFILAGITIWMLSASLRWITRRASPLARSATLLLVPFYAVVLSFLLYDIVTDKIFITGLVFQYSVYIIAMVAILAGIVLIFSIGTVLIEVAESVGRIRSRAINTQLITLGVRVLSIVAIIFLVLQGMQIIGFSLTAIVAGAGVTGLAVALAAQNTLRNVFGSLMLLLDKPFAIGQRVKINNYEGTVEEIGLRSTRLRLLSGHLVSIPNESVAGMDIENLDLRPSIRRTIDLPLDFDTSQNKIRRAEAILHEILSVPDTLSADNAPLQRADQDAETTHPNEAINRAGQLPRVTFNDISSSALNINVTYYYSPPDYSAYLEHCEMINHEIIRRFREEGIYKSTE